MTTPSERSVGAGGNLASFVGETAAGWLAPSPVAWAGGGSASRLRRPDSISMEVAITPVFQWGVPCESCPQASLQSTLHRGLLALVEVLSADLCESIPGERGSLASRPTRDPVPASSAGASGPLFPGRHVCENRARAWSCDGGP